MSELSTHLVNDRRMVDKLEISLEDWGVWRNQRDIALSSPTKTTLKIAEEMRPERLVNIPPTKGELYTYVDVNGRVKVHALQLRLKIYELESMWRKGQERSTNSQNTLTSTYMGNRRMCRINRAVGQLSPDLLMIIVMRYDYGWDHDTVLNNTGIKKDKYFRGLRKAKEQLRVVLKTIK